MAKTRRSKQLPEERGPAVVSTWYRRRRMLVVLCIFLVSFVPGVLWLNAQRPAPASDYKAYLDLALDLVEHHQFGYPIPTANRLPGYPGFLALLVAVAPSYVWLGIWNVALTAAIGVLLYFLVLGLTGGDERAATAAGLLGALNPTFIFFSPLLASEHLFTPLLIGSLTLLAVARGRPGVRAILAGIALGCAILTRGEGLFYVPVALLLVFLVAGKRREKALLSACLLSACLAVVAPWYIRNVVVVGPNVGLSTVGGVNFYYAHNAHQYGAHLFEGTSLEHLDDAARSRKGYREGMAYLREKPSRLLSDIATGTKRLYTAKVTYSVRSALHVPAYVAAGGKAFRRKYPWGSRGLIEKYYIGLVLLGVSSLVFVRRYRRPVWLIPIGIIAMNWLCHAVVFWGKARYRFTMEAFLCVLAGIALSELSRLPWRRLVGRRS